VTVADHMPDQRSSCQWRLLRLRTLVQSEDGLVLPRSIIAEVRDTTNAVITEVEAATRAVLETGPREPGAETFLWVRVTRLKVAADQAINAARDGNVPELLAHLRHFDTLTAAIRTVQQAVYGQEPAHVALSLNEHLGGGSRHDRARADRGRRGLAVTPGRGGGRSVPVRRSADHDQNSRRRAARPHALISFHSIPSRMPKGGMAEERKRSPVSDSPVHDHGTSAPDSRPRRNLAL
jgi:hypothetical protein